MSLKAEIPTWIRVAQDENGFWTCAAATETSPKFHRSDTVIVPDAEAIDKAAKYLRETYRKGQILNDWVTLPKSAKKKWIVLAAGLFPSLASDRDTGEAA
jgi:hypothetical protein